MAWRQSYGNVLESDVNQSTALPLLQSLQKVSRVFNKISDAEWKTILDVGVVLRCTTGGKIIRKDERPSFVAIVLDGSVTQRGQEGEHKVGKGSVIDADLYFLMQHSPSTCVRKASYVADTNVVLFALPFKALEALQTPFPHLHGRILTLLGICSHAPPIAPNQPADDYDDDCLDAPDDEMETVLQERAMEDHRARTVVLDGNFGDIRELKQKNDTLIHEIELLRGRHTDAKQEVTRMQAKYDDVFAQLKTDTKMFEEEKRDRERYVRELEERSQEQTSIKQSYNSILKWVLIKRFCKAHREKRLLRGMYFKLITATTECLSAVAELSPTHLVSVQGFDLDTLETRVRRRVTAWPWMEKRPSDKYRRDTLVSMLRQMDAEAVLVGQSFEDMLQLVKHWKTSCDQLFQENVTMKRSMMENDETVAEQIKMRKQAQAELKEEKKITKKLTWDVEKATRESAERVRRDAKAGKLAPVSGRPRKDHVRSELSAENRMLFARGVELKRRVVALESSIGMLERRKLLLEKQRSDMELAMESFVEEQRLIDANANNKIPFARPSTMALPYLKNGPNGGNGIHEHPVPPTDSISAMSRNGRRVSARKASSARRHKTKSSSSSSSSSSSQPYNLSFALLLPDVTSDQQLLRAVMKRFAEENFDVVEKRVLQLSPAQSQVMTAQMQGSYAVEMSDYITSGPVTGLCLRKSPECVQALRRLVGPQSIQEARITQPVSLRAKYGSNDVKGAVYCSFSKQQSARAIEHFFGHFDSEHDVDSQQVSGDGALALLSKFRAAATRRKARSARKPQNT